MGFFSKLFGFGSSDDSSAATNEEKAPRGRASAPAASSSSDAAPSRSVSLEDLEGFVEFVAKALVDYPDEVKVVSESSRDGKIIKIICRAGDRGKIIGKKGKTIMALRSLVAGAAGRSRERISVEVPDDVEAA